MTIKMKHDKKNTKKTFANITRRVSNCFNLAVYDYAIHCKSNMIAATPENAGVAIRHSWVLSNSKGYKGYAIAHSSALDIKTRKPLRTAVRNIPKDDIISLSGRNEGMVRPSKSLYLLNNHPWSYMLVIGGRRGYTITPKGLRAPTKYQRKRYGVVKTYNRKPKGPKKLSFFWLKRGVTVFGAKKVTIPAIGRHLVVANVLRQNLGILHKSFSNRVLITSKRGDAAIFSASGFNTSTSPGITTKVSSGKSSKAPAHFTKLR